MRVTGLQNTIQKLTELFKILEKEVNEGRQKIEDFTKNKQEYDAKIQLVKDEIGDKEKLLEETLKALDSLKKLDEGVKTELIEQEQTTEQETNVVEVKEEL